MDKDALTILYALTTHLASIAAVATLMGTGHLSEAVGGPILAGLVGIGLGAGTALIVPGASQLPSGPSVQSIPAGGVAPSPTQPLSALQAAPAPIQQVQPLPGGDGAAAGTQGAPGGQPVAT